MNASNSSVGVSPTDFSTEFKWSNQFIPRIRQIIGPLLLRPSTVKEDTEEATDLIMLRAEGIRIACRVRRPGFSQKWGNEITITCRRESGSECEYDKMILGGLADWFFYAHAPDLTPRFLIDLHRARRIIIDAVNMGAVRECGPNRDSIGRRCWFFPVKVSLLQSAIIASRINA